MYAAISVWLCPKEVAERVQGLTVGVGSRPGDKSRCVSDFFVCFNWVGVAGVNGGESSGN